MRDWFDLVLQPGTTIVGKWHKRTYVVRKQLGRGANGVVYQVECEGRLYALKISADVIGLQSEINVLQTMRRQDGARFLFEADDCELAGQTSAFFVMRLVSGEHLREFVARHGVDWLPVLGAQLLRQLDELHGQGYVFADLKSENMLVGACGTVELVDFGGVTPMGQAVRQFSERYDRAHWQAGGRVADADYDLFAFALLCLEVVAPAPLEHLCRAPADRRTRRALLAFVRREPGLRPLRAFLTAAVLGRLGSARAARKLWADSCRGRVLSAAQPLAMPWLKITFASTILLFIYSVFYLVP